MKKYLISFLMIFAFISGMAAYAEESIITIESADSTSFEKDKETGKEQIVLEGAVSISVKKGDVSIRITASYVSFNRATDMIFAQGNVNLAQVSASQGNQNVTASSLLLNVTTLEGVFDDGRILQTQSDAINLPSGSVLVVASEMFGKDSEDTIAFKNGELTFCDDENPHWKIRASNIWLLPGGEFAFFNALLFIGNIPVLYMPAFYYPKDELIFNPSLGYDKRSGYYVQTTTYLYGRKPLNSGSSSSSSSSSDTNAANEIGAALYDFMRPSELKEQVREGIVLHNLNEPYTGNTSDYVKVIGDYYSNLGGVIGVESVFKPKAVLNSINASLKLGFTNTLFESNGNYTNYSYTGNTYYDSSTFLGIHIPFRYAANVNLSGSRPFNFSLSMPLYSDPYFTEDFGKRSEYFDWIGFLLSSADNFENSENKGSQVNSFSWKVNASYNVPLADWIKPYISSLSISDFSSSIDFVSAKNKDIVGEQLQFSPERSYFTPSHIYPAKISGKISGTIVDISSKKTASKSNPPTFIVPLSEPEFALSQDEVESEENNLESEDEKKSAEENANDELVFAYLPDLPIPSLSSSEVKTGFAYTLTYSITPSFTSQLTYSTTKGSPSGFDWEDIYSSYIHVKAPVNLNSNFSYGGSLFSLKNTLEFNPVYQTHPNCDGYSEAGAANLKLVDYKADRLDLSGSNSISVRPFVNNSYFKNTGLDWNSNVKYITTSFIGTVDEPEWDFIPVDFTDEKYVTAHSLSVKFAADEGSSFSQVLTLTSNLPPQKEKYNASLAFVFPYVNLNLSSGVTHVDEKWTALPFTENCSVKLFDNSLTMSQSYKYNLEDKHSESLNLSLSWNHFVLAYGMKYTNEYNYNSAKGWVTSKDKKFQPESVSVSYSNSSSTFKWFEESVTFTPGINTSIVYDFLKPTSSYFRFVPSMSFKIKNFLEVTLSSETRNNVIYRYFQDITGSEYKITGETNPFVDLWNSFVFWGDDCFYDPNQTKRKSSGFKLKSFSLTLKHDLHDWDLASSFSVSPRVVTEGNKKRYDFTPSFSFVVTWRPLSSMKAEIVDEYGTWKLK